MWDLWFDCFFSRSVRPWVVSHISISLWPFIFLCIYSSSHPPTVPLALSFAAGLPIFFLSLWLPSFLFWHVWITGDLLVYYVICNRKFKYVLRLLRLLLLFLPLLSQALPRSLCLAFSRSLFRARATSLSLAAWLRCRTHSCRSWTRISGQWQCRFSTGDTSTMINIIILKMMDIIIHENTLAGSLCTRIVCEPNGTSTSTYNTVKHCLYIQWHIIMITQMLH